MRQDYYTALLAMHAGKPYPEEVSVDEFLKQLPWWKPDQT